MEAVEITIFVAVAIVIGVLMIAFIADIDYMGIYNNIRGDDNDAFQKVDNMTFIGSTMRFWESCGLGAVAKEETVYFTGSTEFTKEKYFNQVKKLNMCNSLQSATFSCGPGENVEMLNPINPPRVIKIECDPVNAVLIIHS